MLEDLGEAASRAHKDNLKKENGLPKKKMKI
jgi:hypothetical protein